MIHSQISNDKGYEEIALAASTVKPVCSICIANYNGMPYLSECIESIKTQSIGIAAIEIIVHDDASTDESVTWIQQNYPEVRILASKENVGYCTSNNRMADAARGEYILLLNNDASLFEDAVELLIERSESQAKKGIITLPQYDRAQRKIIDFGNDLDFFLNPVPRNQWKNRDVSTVHGACLWLPKSLWLELGGFPTWFESVAEDLYLCVYAVCLGYPVEVLKGTGYWHWVGQSFGGGKVSDGRLRSTYIRRYLSERNKTYVMLLFYPASLLLAVVPLHFLFLVLEGVGLAVASRDFRALKCIYLKSIRDVCRKIRLVTRERKRISNSNEINRYNVIPALSFRLRKCEMLFDHGVPKLS
jgi:GT2 family glycosyltransferase